MRELQRLRNELIAKGAKPASINRDFKGLKAALTLYAKSDKRITNRDAWIEGLAALPDAYAARDAYLTDEQVRAGGRRLCRRSGARPGVRSWCSNRCPPVPAGATHGRRLGS